MNFKTLYDETIKTLDEKYQDDLFWLFLEVFNLTKSDYYLSLDQKVDSNLKDKYLNLRNKYLKKNIPVQQLVGYTYFYGRQFLVNKHTLIPRKETEILVEEVIKEIKSKFNNQKDLRVLDLGCGSGIIGITLAKEFHLNVTLVDNSQKALKVALENANLQSVNVNIVKSNWFNKIKGKYDIIISNPPYVKEDELLDEKVLKEPKNALFSGRDGLDSYREILNNIEDYLNSKYIIAFEHGSNQSDAVIKIINDNLSGIKIRKIKDYQNFDRHLIVRSD